METIIKITDAVKTYRRQMVLDHVNMSLKAGEIHGIVGENGSGKTVLLRAICGLIKLDSGSVEVRGKFVGKDFDYPPDIGVIIEHPGFLPRYSAVQNLKMLAALQNKAGLEEIRRAITCVGLDPDDKKYVGHFSLGMKQRLGIAQAIMENPDLLILDEPMSGLDRHSQNEMRQLFLQLKEQGKTLLIATHSNADIRLLCDTVHEMDAGRLTRMDR